MLASVNTILDPLRSAIVFIPVTFALVNVVEPKLVVPAVNTPAFVLVADNVFADTVFPTTKSLFTLALDNVVAPATNEPV